MTVTTDAAASAHFDLWPDHGGFPSWLDVLGFTRGIAVKLGVAPGDADDVASTIVTRMLERNVPAMFIPGTISKHTGEPVTFRAFWAAQVGLYVKGQRDKLNRYHEREHLGADRTMDDGATWAEVFGGSWFDDYSELDQRQFIDRMRAYLAMQPPRSRTDRLDLLALFDELVDQALATGEVNMERVQGKFDIAPSTARSWVSRLRTVMAGAPEDAPPPAFWLIGGEKAGVPEAKAILAALESAKGVMVRDPLQRAGLLLAADAKDKRWYHPFAQEEIALFPDIAIDPQTHKKPAGHVKVAVIHRLRRMLDEAGMATPATAAGAGPEVAPSPAPAVPETGAAESGAEPEPTPHEVLEAELFRLGADAAKVDHILSLVSDIGLALLETACA